MALYYKLKRTMSNMCDGTPTPVAACPVKRVKSEPVLCEEGAGGDDDWGWFTSTSPEAPQRGLVTVSPRTARRLQIGVPDFRRDPLGARLADYERERLRSLAATRCFGSPREACYDAITARFTEVLNMPISFVTLVGEASMHIKSVCDRRGPCATGPMVPCVMPVGAGQESLCAYATKTAAHLDATGHDVDAVVSFPDTLNHPDFCRFPWVAGAPHIRSYFGAPLRVRPEPHAPGRFVGMLCVADVERPDAPHRPIRRSLAAHEAEALKRGAEAVVANLERFCCGAHS